MYQTLFRSFTELLVGDKCIFVFTSLAFCVEYLGPEVGVAKKFYTRATLTNISVSTTGMYRHPNEASAKVDKDVGMALPKSMVHFWQYSGICHNAGMVAWEH